jgi:hypothetical protein
MDENQFLDKFKEKFGTKKEQNETGDAEDRAGEEIPLGLLGSCGG